MSDATSPLAFFQRRPVQILTALLLLQAAVFYGRARTTEAIPPGKPLSEFPDRAGAWQLIQEGVVDKETRDVLQADDLLTRMYASPVSPAAANLFVAYFRSQRSGKAPHSPKNCLPGSGWEANQSGTMAIPVPGYADPLVVNRYLVSRGDSKSLVLYWYQTPYRVVASEYWAKIYLVLDAIRHNRSDTAMVRIVVPVLDNGDKAAEQAAIDFVRSVFPGIRTYFPV